VRTHERAPKQLRDQLERESANVFTTEIAAVAADFDERIVNQYALSSLASQPDLSLDGELLRKIVIPAELKWEIRDKLNQANVTERVLFPGLDKLSRWLARYYTPRR
jgi:hypothetical protein